MLPSVTNVENEMITDNDSLSPQEDNLKLKSLFHPSLSPTPEETDCQNTTYLSNFSYQSSPYDEQIDSGDPFTPSTDKTLDDAANWSILSDHLSYLQHPDTDGINPKFYDDNTTHENPKLEDKQAPRTQDYLSLKDQYYD